MPELPGSQTRIAAYIDLVRLSAGFSLQRLALVTGIRERDLYTLLTGARPAKVPELVHLARVMGITVRELTGDAARLQPEFMGPAGDLLLEAMRAIYDIHDYLADQGIPGGA